MPRKHARRPRQDPLLSGPPTPDPRLHGNASKVDPNTAFLGEASSVGGLAGLDFAVLRLVRRFMFRRR